MKPVTKPPTRSGAEDLVVHGIAGNRACHTVSAAASASQLGADDSNDFDAFLAQQRIGISVAIVRVDDTWRGANEIGTTVPLRPLALVVAAAGLDHPKFF
jgi:hypothetical protein